MKKVLRTLSLLLVILLLAPAALADLRRGAEGDEVTNLQLMLFETGWLFELPDGKFGRNTEAAVKAYEKYAGLPVDGVADEAMLSALTADWRLLMAEMGRYDGDESFPADLAYPFFCTHWRAAEGSSTITYCEAHHQLCLQAERLMSTGSAEDARKACALWQAEILRLYDQWYDACTEENHSAVTASRALFLSWAEAQRVAIDGWYATFQILPGAGQVEYALEISLREQAAWLCAMISGSLATGEEGQ